MHCRFGNVKVACRNLIQYLTCSCYDLAFNYRIMLRVFIESRLNYCTSRMDCLLEAHVQCYLPFLLYTDQFEKKIMKFLISLVPVVATNAFQKDDYLPSCWGCTHCAAVSASAFQRNVYGCMCLFPGVCIWAIPQFPAIDQGS